MEAIIVYWGYIRVILVLYKMSMCSRFLIISQSFLGGFQGRWGPKVGA